MHNQKSSVKYYSFNTVVIGSGCAGFNAADSLFNAGVKNIALVCEGINMGTSRNTGSDKQTYYKLALAGDCSDSVNSLAQTFFSGGSVHGDTALAEAAGSVQSFMKLVNLGVPFPTNEFGEFVGYKTDHDPLQRATSCGPLTSKLMTETLHKEVQKKKIKIMDEHHVIKILKSGETVAGILALNLAALQLGKIEVAAIQAENVVAASGGPAIVYEQTVYPQSQTGMTGTILAAGAKACNLQEWQYGIASIAFRWNVSGTYQQVLPRYISVDKDGNTKEFLTEYFDSSESMLNAVFLKGYQWPFDVKKLHGSSIIDMIIYHEIFKNGNRVFLDFRSDPTGLAKDLINLPQEAYSYLKKSNALLETPIKRLAVMNPGAIDLYRNHGIDLYCEPLEIAVCAQHCNGGIDVDRHWETNIQGLYAVGEAAGTFGVYRPGGAALNSTQVGSLRAAEHIAGAARTVLGHTEFYDLAKQEVEGLEEQINCLIGNKSNINEQRVKYEHAMSCHAGQFRNLLHIKKLKEELAVEISNFFKNTKVDNYMELGAAFKNWDMLITQYAMLDAMELCHSTTGSRGSALVTRGGTEEKNISELPDMKYMEPKEALNDKVIVTVYNEGRIFSETLPVRKIPKSNDWFETVWKEYNERKSKPVRREK